MDEAETKRRWKTSQELFQAADAVFKQEYHRACVGLVYYACFQAMWVALGNPPLGEWRHGGITRRFCHGQWTQPPHAPTSLSGLHKRLLALYELRLDAHYRALSIPPQQARQGLDTAAEVIRLVQQHTPIQPQEEL
jgi:uncharacterized protein (UPF0332 family)